MINGENYCTEVIYKSTNYGRFNYFKENRMVRENRVKEIMGSMLENDLHYLTPIDVDENYNIIDGQHRFEARRNLGLPIFYKVHKNRVSISDIITLNTHKTVWGKTDMAYSYDKQGNENYGFILKLMEAYSLPLECVLIICRNGCSGYEGNRKIEFSKGNFKVNDVQKINDFIKKWLDLSNFTKNRNKRGFVFACAILFNTPKYDHERMLRKLKAKGDILMQFSFSDCKSYIKLFNEIYNFGQSDKNKLYFKTKIG